MFPKRHGTLIQHSHLWTLTPSLCGIKDRRDLLSFHHFEKNVHKTKKNYNRKRFMIKERRKLKIDN